jgi:predicted transcriptional regulator
MMRSSLITILLSSEKRTNLLLLLNEKSRTIEEINQELDTNSVAILPQLKRLKENGLVFQEEKIYSLSLLGKIIVRKMQPLVNAFRLLEDNYDYWSGIRPGGIPVSFFKRMERLDVHTPGRYHGDTASSLYQEIEEAFSNSKQISFIISYPNQRYPGICASHAQKGMKVSVILTQRVAESFLTNFKKELDTLVFLENSDVYILDKITNPPTIAVTDTMVLACFSSGKNDFNEEKNSMVSFGADAKQWGLELFEYFRALAKPFVFEPSQTF